MPVTHGRNRYYKERYYKERYYREMTEPHQYFEVGEKFLYTPKSDPSVSIVIEPVEEIFVPMCLGCAIVKYCNSKYNTCNDGIKFIPECHSVRRPDGKGVMFKESKG